MTASEHLREFLVWASMADTAAKEPASHRFVEPWRKAARYHFEMAFGLEDGSTENP